VNVEDLSQNETNELKRETKHATTQHYENEN